MAEKIKVRAVPGRNVRRPERTDDIVGYRRLGKNEDGRVDIAVPRGERYQRLDSDTVENNGYYRKAIKKGALAVVQDGAVEGGKKAGKAKAEA